MELRGKVAVVTGGAVRIGRAVCQALATEGMRVCVHYGRSHQAAKELVEELRRCGTDADCVQADLRRPVEAAHRVFEFASERFGQVHVLVNNAAIFEPSTWQSTTEELWERHVAINLKAPFFLSQQFASRLQAECGHIVNLVDWRAEHVSRGYLVYSLTKAGLASLTRLLALELAPTIQVNAVALGAILPPAVPRSKSVQPTNAHLQETKMTCGPGSTATERPAAQPRIVERIPLRKLGDLSEVTRAVLFLLKSEFVTGEVLYVTGGEELTGV